VDVPQLRFAFKAADEVGLVGVLGQDDLDCHFPLDELLAGAVDGIVGAFPVQLKQLVAYKEVC
jgi:hypothetical protein